MATVSFQGATCVYPGASVPAVDELNLDISDGEFMVLVGPSGCGKSTSLRMLAGLEEVYSGNIFIDERDVTMIAPKNRDIAMVFQNYALYPHMTVAENMGFALKIARVARPKRKERVNSAAELLDLMEYLARKPKQLSGGQRQRVAMGRAIVRSPRVFCMDEPLSNLDAKLRVSTRTQIASLQRRLGITTVYVTHDQVEAMTMGDRVAVMKDGLLQQVDSPLGLYDDPVNLFVAGFIGSPAMNLLEGELTDEGATVLGHRFEVPVTPAVRSRSGREVTIGIRPEDFQVTSDETDLPVVVSVVEELGADAYVYGAVGGTVGDDGGVSSGIPVVVRIEARSAIQRGTTIHVKARVDRCRVFATSTGERLDNQV